MRILLAASLLAGATLAEGTSAQAAAKAVAAFEAADAGALEALAANDKPDPWHVVHDLCCRGAFDAAAAFATAAPRKDVETLPAYVVRMRAQKPDRAGPRALDQAVRAFADGRPDAVLAALKSVDTSVDDVPAAEAMYSRGYALRMLGRPSESADAFVAAAGMAERMGWLSRAGAAWRGATESIDYAGDLRRTLDGARRTVAVQRRRGNAAAAAAALGYLGLVHWRLGNLSASFRCLEEGLEVSDEDPAETAAMLRTLALVHRSTGRFREAVKLQERALAIDEDAANLVGAAESLRDLGLLHIDLGEYEKSLEYLSRVLVLMQYGGEKTLAAQALALMADAERRRGGRAAEAHKLFRQALAVFEEANDGVFAGLALAFHARLHIDEKKYDEARAALERADKLLTEYGFHVTGGARDGLARVDLAEGQPARAVERMRRLVSEVYAAGGGLEASGQAGLIQESVGVFETGIRAGLALDDPAEVCFFLESARAVSLLHTLGSASALRDAILPDALRAAEATARQREAQAMAAYRTAVAGGNRFEILARRQALDAARAEMTAVIRKIQREARTAASLSFPTADPLDVIQKRLAPRDAIVYYALLTRFEDESAAAALVVTRKGARIVKLAPPADIDRACRALGLEDPTTDPAEAVAALRKLVLDPLGLDPKTERLLVCPDQILTYLPFAVLDPRRPVAYVPSATVHGFLRREPAERGRKVLALGDPDYRGALPALPATREEAKAVGDRTILGGKATLAALWGAVEGGTRWRSVHLACHGHFDAQRPLLATLALAPDGEDDGRLRAIDILRRQVPADLVVLSACETARGKVFRGEGLVGLPRAFMFAGAPRVIVSLWKVDDEATRALMVKFYELWSASAKATARVPTATALRKAQEHVASHARWSHPYYWAAWQLWGLGD